MTTTVVGVFEEFGPAFSAKNELIASGFSWTAVQLVPDHEIPLKERSATPRTDPNSVSFNMQTLFTGLFGARDTSHSNLYAEAVRRGGYVVTIDTHDDAERARRGRAAPLQPGHRRGAPHLSRTWCACFPRAFACTLGLARDARIV